MNNNLHIFVDLDECLVSTIYSANPKKNRTKLSFTCGNGKVENYYTVLRPMAMEFLSFCRRIAPTYILTAAAKDYAQEHNRVHSLGFSDEQILGREDYMDWWSGDHMEAFVRNQYPNSILIDNQSLGSFGSENLRVKMEYLGIKENRLVKSREYVGGKQPSSFDKEIDQIQKILLAIIN
jgi:hypothetical protein